MPSATTESSITAPSKYLAHATRLVEHWFLHPRHRMQPHLRYAHVRRGWLSNRGTTMGLLEGRVLVGVTDALRLLVHAREDANGETCRNSPLGGGILGASCRRTAVSSSDEERAISAVGAESSPSGGSASICRVLWGWLACF